MTTVDLANLFGKAYAELLRATEPVNIAHYGPHTVTTYRDGRRNVLTRRQFQNADVYGPTPFEHMQLGLEMPACAPETDFLWCAEKLQRHLDEIKDVFMKSSAADAMNVVRAVASGQP